MASTTPRYVLPGTGTTYEIPIVAVGRRAPVATLAVPAASCDAALTTALEWAVLYSAKKSHAHYPQVRHRDKLTQVRKIYKGYAWLENDRHFGWVPVKGLCA